MLGRRSPQRELFRPDQLLLEHVGLDTFYGQLSRRGPEIFRDQDFAELYVGAVGRPSVPPSQLCVLLLLQAREGCSDAEAIERTAYDLRWKVALGLELEDKLCAKSTLQMFRAKLVLHEAHGKLFESSVEACRQAGLLKQRKLEVAIDTTPVLGRGAVKDTFNLISEQIREVVRAACGLKSWDEDAVVAEQGLTRHFGTSFKGEVELDWSDADAKRALVAQLVADARIALSLAREALRGYSKTAEGTQRLRDAQRLLSELLLQDVEEEPEDGGGPSIRRGTARDRVISRTDPEMRHGHKSHSKPFDGYKASVVVDTREGVILATDVRPANVADAEGTAELIQRAGKAAKQDPARVLGDTAYGGIATRKELAEQGVQVIAKAPPIPGKAFFTHVDFKIDERRGEARCPAGRTSIRCSPTRKRMPGRTYYFSRNDCNDCELRSLCVKSDIGARSVTVTEHTKVLNKLRRAQKTKRFRNAYRRRVVVEHRIGRLVALGIRKARYFGHAKVGFQVLLAAAVANLTLAASSSHRGAYMRALHRLVAAAASILTRQPGRSIGASAPALGALRMAAFRPAL
jgi:transposase/IS5 family transposase